MELELAAHLKLLGEKVEGLGKRLEAWQYQLWRDLNTVSGVAVTGQSLIFNLGSPPSGYRWRVRAIQATGPNITPIAGVDMDIYVGSVSQPGPNQAASTQAAGGIAVPSIGAWWASNYTASTPGSVPQAYFPGGDELSIPAGDNLLVVLSGTGVTTGVTFYVGGAVDQYQGFSELHGGPRP